MGNTKTQDKDHDHDQQYYDHPQLGRLVQLQQDSTLQMKITLPSRQEYTAWADQLPRLTGQNQVVLLPLRHQYQQTGFCGFSGMGILQFDNFPFQLDLQINQRMGRQHRFNQHQIWYVLFSLLEAVVDSQQSPHKVMDIRPRNVVLSPDGQVKLITKLTYPNFQNGMIKAMTKKDSCFLAPQQLLSLQQGITFPKILFPVAENFSIGMTILQACALRRVQGLYNMDTYSLDYKTLDSYIKDLNNQSMYSKFLIRTIQLMLQHDYHKRLSCGQLWSSLLPYQNQIFNFQSFTPNRQASAQFSDKYYRTIDTWPHFAQYYKTRGTRSLPFDVLQLIRPGQSTTTFPRSSQQHIYPSNLIPHTNTITPTAQNIPKLQPISNKSIDPIIRSSNTGFSGYPTTSYHYQHKRG